MKFEQLRNETIKIINESNIDNPKLITLINKIIAVSNPNIRVYYNLSIQNFVDILENTNFVEFDGILKSMDSKIQYSIETKDSLDDLIEFLIEENDYSLLEKIQKSTKKINNNLFIYETGQLSPKYWI